LGIKAAVFTALIFLNVHAFDWEYTKRFSLQKDELKKVYITSKGVERLFTMRWTLFTANELVVLSSFDEFNKQVLLKQGANGLNAFKVELLPRARADMDTPYLYIRFNSFDFESEKATFQLFLKDKKAKILLKFEKESIN